ncbi:hypothetical protein FQA47_020315 [Oryzias melastigma]|uniref:Uncharacterized protein n=1 Tax=Oryzias melastigma TaxID=30732 RepID=A0A834FKQ2_ORYME|nr:hypothetical protein FQA47_020315 [Oryzias melastigma]
MIQEKESVFTCFVRVVKAAAYHFLNRCVSDLRKEECYGCQVDHPSQTQHPCLFDIEDGFIDIHFQILVKKLLTPEYTQAVRMLLYKEGILFDDSRILGVTDALLYELKFAARHTGGDVVKMMHE